MSIFNLYIPTYSNSTYIFVFSTMNVNCRGMVRVSQAVANNMIDAKIKGSIVNTSSTISQVNSSIC